MVILDNLLLTKRLAYKTLFVQKSYLNSCKYVEEKKSFN